MHYEILRNCSHGSEIYTFLKENKQGKFFFKASSSIDGIQDIRNEYKGWEWYKSRNREINDKLINYEVNRKDYVRLKIDELKGSMRPIKLGIKQNFDFLIKVIKHYKLIWNFRENVPMHGDLSLANILFYKEQVFFIDWEHFNFNCSYWGFDIYYLLYEILWFNWHKFLRSKRQEIFYISKLIKILNYDSKLMDEKVYLLSYLIKFIENNKNLWSTQLSVNLDKLPVLNYDKKDILYIDNLMREFLRN